MLPPLVPLSSALLADGLGMLNQPGGEVTDRGPGHHVMAVSMLAWLSEAPLARWGMPWLENGGIELRYRSGLEGGTPLRVRVEEDARGRLRLSAEAVGRTAVDGVAWPPGSAGPDVRRPVGLTGVASRTPGSRLERTPEALAEQELEQVVFRFDADRDLAPMADLPNGDWWRAARLAHPAWVASGVHLLVKRNIDIPDSGWPASGWLIAGSAIRHLGAIRHGDEVVLRSRVARVFTAGGHEFADLDVVALVDDVARTLLRTTVVYLLAGAQLP